MKRNKIILAALILSMIALVFSGCGGGGNPTTPPIEDEEQEYVVEEKSFNVDADQGGTFSLSDGTELVIDPGDLSDDAYVVLKKICYDLDSSKASPWFLDNAIVYIVEIFDCNDVLDPIDFYIARQLEYVAGEVSGGIVKFKNDTFELVKEFTIAEEEKVQVSVVEISTTVYLVVTDPFHHTIILNDLYWDIMLAVQYYYDGNCTSLDNLYQQALQEESVARIDLENHPGVTKEDAEEIFYDVVSLRTVVDEFIVGPILGLPYAVYSAFINTGQVCKYTNAYIIAQNKAEIYSSKITKRRNIEYLYEQGGCTENHAPVILSIAANPSSIDINQTSTITCTASDEDAGDTLTYTWTKTGGTITGSGSAIIWTAPSTEGTYTITCTVSDGEGGEDSESKNIPEGRMLMMDMLTKMILFLMA